MKCRVFVKELAILHVKCQLINEQLLAIQERIDCIDEEVEELDEN